MAHIRAVMVTTPEMLSELIARLAPERIDLEIVAELGTRDGLMQNLQLLGPDLVVIGLRPKETDAVVRSLLKQLPATKFVALSADGRTVLAFEHRVHRVELTDASPQALVDFLRGSPEYES